MRAMPKRALAALATTGLLAALPAAAQAGTATPEPGTVVEKKDSSHHPFQAG